MSDTGTNVGEEGFADPRNWKQAFERFGLAATGVIITILITQASAIAGWAGGFFESSKIETGDAIPVGSKLDPSTYDKIVQDAETEDNQEAIMNSLNCLDALGLVEWREFTPGLFIKGVICDNGNTVYELTDIPSLPERTVHRGISANWFKRKYIETLARLIHDACRMSPRSGFCVPVAGF